MHGLTKHPRTLLRNLTNLLFPPTCWATNSPADRGSLSHSAREAIARLSAKPYCHRCGLDTGPYAPVDGKQICGRCHERELTLHRIARVGTFSEPLITLVHRLKFSSRWEISEDLGAYLFAALLRTTEQTAVPIDALVPIPLHWRRRIHRGFNQADELARAAGKIGRWPIIHALRRTRPTTAQSQTDSRTARLENLAGAFVARPNKHLAQKHIWLIDDVTTTGATLHAAATALRKLPKPFRPASINAAVICVTDHKAPA